MMATANGAGAGLGWRSRRRGAGGGREVEGNAPVLGDMPRKLADPK